MKSLIFTILSLLIPITSFAEGSVTPTLSSDCQIRSLPSERNRSTVEYSWKITAETSEDRVLSVDQLTRDPESGVRGGTRHFEYCKPGSTHEQEIILKVDQNSDGEERACWFEGLVENANFDIPLPESAVVSVSTRQISGDDEAGHLIGITVSNNGRELRRHFIFISFVSPAELQNALPAELSEEEREPRDGNEWQIFTDPKGWEPAFRRLMELEE